MTSIKLVPFDLNKPDEEEEEEPDDLPDGRLELDDAPNSVMPPGESETDTVPEEIKSGVIGLMDFLSDKVETMIGRKGDTASVASEDLAIDHTMHQAASDGSIMNLQQAFKYIEESNIPMALAINKLNLQGYSALHLAARYNRKEAISFLLDKGANIDIIGTEYGFTPLHLAAKYDMVAAVKCLLQRGAAAGRQNIYGTTPLHFTARRGNAELCKLLLDHGDVSANTTDNSLSTPLHAAMLGGSAEATRLLIDYEADIDACDIEGERPIHIAAAEDHCDLIVMLAKGALKKVPESEREQVQRNFVNAVSHENNTALHVAAQAGYNETVKTLISIGADINVRNDTLKTPLHLAAASGQLAVVKFLIMNKARINIQDDQQMTPLHKACQYGRLDIVRYLNEHGARIDSKDNENFTPLLCAVWKGQNEVVDYLLQSGAKINVPDTNMKTVLHIAIEEGWDETLALLIKRGGHILINSVDKDYKSPLHYAANAGNEEVITLLLSKSATVDCVDNEERTPIHIAAESGRKSCVELLGKAAPGIINSTDERGRSPLHLAAIKGHKRVCHSLIEMGAETSSRDDVNWTPLDYAARFGHFKTVKLLLDNDAPVDACDMNLSTPLHHASTYGHIDCITVLLDHGASISQQNILGKNCLDLAVENNHKDACMAFITHKRWKEALNHVDNEGVHPMEKLIGLAPEVAEVVLNNSIHHSKHSVKHPDYSITYSFEYVDLHPDDQVNDLYFGPSSMVKHRCEKLLSHPLTVALIDDKFARLGRWIYLANLAVYITFVALLTSLVVIDKERMSNTSERRSKTTFQLVVPWIIMFLTIAQIIKEIVQFFNMRLSYFKDMINYLEMILYILTMVFLIPFIIENLDSNFNTSAPGVVTDEDYLEKLESIKWNTGAITILFAWGNLLLYFQRFPLFGLYVVMFTEVFKTVMSVLVVFSIFIVAFSLSFFVLLDSQDAFKYVGRAIVKTAVMAIGEFEYKDVFTANIDNPTMMPYKVMSFLVFMLFLVIMPILIMNLLVGLAIGDIEAVRKTAYLRILKKQVRMLTTFDRTYPKWLLRTFYYPYRIQKPNEKRWHVRLFNWLIGSNYDSLKEEQLEMAGNEQLIFQELTSNRQELDKQKKRMKSLIELIEDQVDVTKKIAEKLQLGEND